MTTDWLDCELYRLHGKVVQGISGESSIPECALEIIILLGHKPKKVGGLRVDQAETPENCLEKG